MLVCCCCFGKDRPALDLLRRTPDSVVVVVLVLCVGCYLLCVVCCVLCLVCFGLCVVRCVLGAACCVLRVQLGRKTNFACLY